MNVNSMTHNATSGRYHFAQTVASGATSEPLSIPSIYPHDPGFRPAAVLCKPAAGASGRIEFSLDTPAVVLAGTAAWSAWPHGAVTQATADAINGPVTALRCVSISGQVEWGVLL